MGEHELPPLPPRPPDAHKGAMGRVVLIAGSRGMAGAAALAVEGALRGGAGYALLVCPASITPDLTAAQPAALLAPCGDASRAALQAEDAPRMREALRGADALVIGPGLGPASGAELWLEAVLRERAGLPIVLDADALNALARGGPVRLASLPDCAVLTPHPGEAARLLGWPEGASRVQADRGAALTALTAATPAIALLKGAGTLVGQRGRKAWRNPTGNPGMATAGAGDVLAGLIGALLARGMSPWDAARAGAWLHGRAGDLIASGIGEDALIASDLGRALGAAEGEYRRASAAGGASC